jgi:hypothetical protein
MRQANMILQTKKGKRKTKRNDPGFEFKPRQVNDSSHQTKELTTWFLIQLAWQRVDARPASCLDLELVCGGTRSQGADRHSVDVLSSDICDDDQEKRDYTRSISKKARRGFD